MTGNPHIVMLIDDNRFDNYYHEYVIKKFDPGLQVLVYDSAEEALEFLQKADGDHFPEYIFLDINMPGLNGWEFIEEFSNILDQGLARAGLIILTTSENPDDIARAKKISCVSSYCVKPLNPEILGEVLRPQVSPGC